MVRKIGRRVFILSAVVSALSLYVGGWWAFKVRRNDSTGIIVAILRKRLGYLKLDGEGLVAFARDFQARTSGGLNRSLSWRGILRPLYAYVDIFKILPKSGQFRSIEDLIVKQFLLSSDFFWHDADESRTVRYMEYYDPYEVPCANPFARF